MTGAAKLSSSALRFGLDGLRFRRLDSKLRDFG
jgi:hypothetical protein